MSKCYVTVDAIGGRRDTYQDLGATLGAAGWVFTHKDGRVY